MTTSPAIRYARTTVLVVVVLVFAVGTINFVIDPFGMNNVILAQGLNTFKPATYTRVRLFKAYEVARVRPQSLILGTSRSHIGFRCSHEAWAHMDAPCYNLAFDGATAREIYWYLRHAYAVRPLKHVLLGLEPYHLAPSLSTTRPDFDPLVLHNPDGDLLPRWFTGNLRILTSVDTLKASFETLAAQSTPGPTWFAPDGQRLGEVFFRQIDGKFKQLNPRGYFHMTDEREVGYQTDWMVAARHKRPVLRPEPRLDPDEISRAYVKRIVAFCRRHQIDLRIILTPAHAHQLEIMAATGSWEEVERKKRDLVRLVEDENLRYPDQPATPVFDFSGYSFVTEDEIPAPGSQAELRYYWDSSHFKQIVGDYVLDRVYSIADASRTVPPGFGVILNVTTMDAYLASERLRQEDYRRRFPADIAMLRQLVDDALRDDHE